MMKGKEKFVNPKNDIMIEDDDSLLVIAYEAPELFYLGQE